MGLFKFVTFFVIGLVGTIAITSFVGNNFLFAFINGLAFGFILAED